MEWSVDEKRSYIERAVAFPDNVEVEATQTGTPQNPPPGPGGPGGGPPPGRKKIALSVLAHWSMIRLPARPCRPGDATTGWDSLPRRTSILVPPSSARPNGAISPATASRRRDTTAAVSDPAEPLVYYIDPATPKEWVPWIKKGIEAWQPAFEAAGFSHAIVARDVPTNDSGWSMEDVRHTVVRWLATTVENSVGPNVHDPRTGDPQRIGADVPQHPESPAGLVFHAGRAARSARSICHSPIR